MTERDVFASDRVTVLCDHQVPGAPDPRSSVVARHAWPTERLDFACRHRRRCGPWGFYACGHLDSSPLTSSASTAVPAELTAAESTTAPVHYRPVAPREDCNSAASPALASGPYRHTTVPRRPQFGHRKPSTTAISAGSEAPSSLRPSSTSASPTGVCLPHARHEVAPVSSSTSNCSSKPRCSKSSSTSASETSGQLPGCPDPGARSCSIAPPIPRRRQRQPMARVELDLANSIGSVPTCQTRPPGRHPAGRRRRCGCQSERRSRRVPAPTVVKRCLGHPSGRRPTGGPKATCRSFIELSGRSADGCTHGTFNTNSHPSAGAKSKLSRGGPRVARASVGHVGLGGSPPLPASAGSPTSAPQRRRPSAAVRSAAPQASTGDGGEAATSSAWASSAIAVVTDAARSSGSTCPGSGEHLQPTVPQPVSQGRLSARPRPSDRAPRP